MKTARARVEIAPTTPFRSDLDRAWHLACAGEPDKAYRLATAALLQMRGGEERRDTGRAHLEISWYCFQCGLSERGLSYARVALRQFHKNGDQIGEAQSRALEAWLLLELGMVELAIEKAMDALKLAERTFDLKTCSLAFNVVGIVFWAANKPDQAVHFLERAIDLARSSGERNFECWWLINLGGAHSNAAYASRAQADEVACKQSIEAALRYTAEARALAKSLNDGWAERLCVGNTAEYLNFVSEHEEAAAALLGYLVIGGTDTNRGRAHYLLELSRTLLALKQLDSATDRLLEASQLGTQTKNLESVMLSKLLLSEVSEEKGDFRASLAYFKEYHILQQQYVAERTQRHARLAALQYETTKQRLRADTEEKRANDLARSRDELQLRAETLAAAVNIDPLTQLANRRMLETVLKGLDDTAQSYCIAMIDIDHFKAVNDTYSHMIGDHVLAQTAMILAESSVSGAFVARYGGEEFSLVLTNFRMHEALAHCEHIRQAVSVWAWEQIAPSLNITISIGLATPSIVGEMSSDVIRRADQCLYAAKAKGRNCVVADAEYDGNPKP